MLAVGHDVEADREACRRTLAGDVAVGAVEHHLALIELAALDELQVQRLAEAAVDGFGVVIIIVADIAGAEIARRQEVEIMVVRDAIGKGRGTAGGIDGVARRRPQVGAQVKTARAAVEQEDLRRIAIDFELVGIACLERRDDAVGEEVAVAPEPGEQRGAMCDARFAGQVDAAVVEARGDFGEVERGAGGRFDQAGHGMLKSSPSGEALGGTCSLASAETGPPPTPPARGRGVKSASVACAARRTSGCGSPAAITARCGAAAAGSSATNSRIAFQRAAKSPVLVSAANNGAASVRPRWRSRVSAIARKLDRKSVV